MPTGVGVKELVVVGMVGGVGFTMALFIAGLAFTDPAQLGAAKLFVLVGSGLAGVIGLVYGAIALPKGGSGVGAQTPTEAESATNL